MLGLRHELADRHVFDHAPAQRADGLVGHGGAPVLSEVVEHLDLRTGRFHRLRLLIITRAAPQAPYRERFSPCAITGREQVQQDTPEQERPNAQRPRHPGGSQTATLRTTLPSVSPFSTYSCAAQTSWKSNTLLILGLTLPASIKLPISRSSSPFSWTV